MRAARCSPCGINYPYDKEVCPICGGTLWLAEAETHDLDWREQVEASKEPQMAAPIRDVVAEVLRKDGHYFVADLFLQEAGYNVSVGDIVKINGAYFEINGKVYENSNVPGWWIELVQELKFNAPVLSEKEYEDLDKRRGLRT